MRYLKSILVALIFSILVLAGLGFFLKPNYQVERSIVIKASSDSIFPYVASLKKWPSWTVWNNQKDASLKLSYSGPEKGTGSKQSWEGEIMEEGEIEITGLREGKELNYEVKLEDNFKSKGTLLLEPQGMNTRIRWKMEGDAGYNIPQRYFILFIDKLFGPDMEEGLSKLKKICETE